MHAAYVCKPHKRSLFRLDSSSENGWQPPAALIGMIGRTLKPAWARRSPMSETRDELPANLPLAPVPTTSNGRQFPAAPDCKRTALRAQSPSTQLIAARPPDASGNPLPPFSSNPRGGAETAYPARRGCRAVRRELHPIVAEQAAIGTQGSRFAMVESQSLKAKGYLFQQPWNEFGVHYPKPLWGWPANLPWLLPC